MKSAAPPEQPDVSRRELRIEHYVALTVIVIVLVSCGIWLLT